MCLIFFLFGLLEFFSGIEYEFIQFTDSVLNLLSFIFKLIFLLFCLVKLLLLFLIV